MNVDTLIIGSGVAATVIAKTLLEADPKASILILEAGTRVKTKDYGIWMQYLMSGHLPFEDRWDLPYPKRDVPGENQVEGLSDFSLAGSRVFAYGGSTLHWGGWALRLKPEDFRLQSLTGQSLDWPIDYEDLEPFYCQAEQYLAVSGDSEDATVHRSQPYPFRAFPFTLQDEPLAKGLQSLGIHPGKMPIARRGVSDVPSRHAPCQTTGTCKYCPFGARYVAGNYLDDMRAWNDYPNLEIRLGVPVEAIHTSTASRVNGVEYLDWATGTRHSVSAERIIVAAGTVESAKLLLRSTTPEWPTGLGNSSDQVGRNIVTHPYFILIGTASTNPRALQPEMNFPTLICRHFDSEAEQKAGKFILVNPPDTVPINVAGLMQAGFRRERIDEYIRTATPVTVHGMIEVFSRAENRVLNVNRRNRFGVHETLVKFVADPGFAQRTAQIKEHVAGIYQSMGATLSGFQNISWRMDHAAATCRMSVDPAQGVVDPDLRVHGIDNLYVCSNAVFPNIGSINPTLTLTALALRLGQHLSARNVSGAVNGHAAQ